MINIHGTHKSREMFETHYNIVVSKVKKCLQFRLVVILLTLLLQVTLSRPKGPAARRKPHRFLQILSSSDSTRDVETLESSLVTNLEHTNASLSHSTLQKDHVDGLKAKTNYQTTTGSHTKSSPTRSCQLVSHKKTVPVADFTSLAPEILQEPVRQGWKEDVEDDKPEDILSPVMKTRHELEVEGIQERNRIHGKYWTLRNQFRLLYIHMNHRCRADFEAPLLFKHHSTLSNHESVDFPTCI